MRKLSALALVSCLTLGATAAFAAQTTPSTSMDKPAAGSMSKSTKTTTTMTKTTTTTKPGHASGKVTAVDCTAHTVTIKDTYTTSDTTKMTSKGKAITCADVHVGDTVSVTYTKDGATMNASKVTVTKAAKM